MTKNIKPLNLIRGFEYRLINHLENTVVEPDVLFHDGAGRAGFEAFRAGIVEAPQIAGPEFLITRF